MRVTKDIKSLVKGGVIGFALSFVGCAIPYVGDVLCNGYTKIRELVGGKN